MNKLQRKILEMQSRNIANQIRELSKKYNEEKAIYLKLIDLYNKLIPISRELKNSGLIFSDLEIFKLEEDIRKGVIPLILTVESKPLIHDIDNELLPNLAEPKAFYSPSEVETLLKWTVNNTRKNLEILNDYKNNADLTGSCGFSQFSSLYPLSKLGLKITINNVGSFCDMRHAFGTVTFPTLINGKIENIDYLIDCTYSQFLHLNRCNINCETISPGFFMASNYQTQKLASDLVQDGYMLATEENLKNYMYGFYMSAAPKDKINETISILQNQNISQLLKERTEPFDYNESEFLSSNYNFDVSSALEENKKR